MTSFCGPQGCFPNVKNMMTNTFSKVGETFKQPWSYMRVPTNATPYPQTQPSLPPLTREQKAMKIREWVANNMSRAGDIALYCNVPSDAKIMEIYNGCVGCTEQQKNQLLADYKQDCILARIEGRSFDMGTNRQVGTTTEADWRRRGLAGGRKTARRRRKKTKRRITVRRYLRK